MKHTQEEITKSLEVIQEICKEQEYCDDCPFYSTRISDCNITNDNPRDWCLRDKETWRAFE